MPVMFYRYSYREAKRNNELDLYQESKAENMRCKKYVQDKETGFFNNAYKDFCVDKDGAYTKFLIEKFGMGRVMNMFAATVNSMRDDPRLSKETVKWAKEISSCVRLDDTKEDLVLTELHPGIVDILTKKVQSEYSKLNLFSAEQCEPKNMDLTGKVIVIAPRRLKEEYWSPENQLWLATGGFGCRPDASGRAVYAICLSDGDESRWNREDVLGVIKDEHLPDWAREKLEELQAPEMESGITMN